MPRINKAVLCLDCNHRHQAHIETNHVPHISVRCPECRSYLQRVLLGPEDGVVTTMELPGPSTAPPPEALSAHDRRHLHETDVADIDSNWINVRNMLIRWYSHYKAWERTDTFQQAFRESRMTVRYSKRGLKNSFTMNARRTGVREIQTFQGQTYDCGMTGVLSRLSPGNVTRVNRLRLGLHSMSATLLTPERLIADQVFTRQPEEAYFVFMPLPQEPDQALMLRLEEIRTASRQRELVECIDWIQQRVTNITYAHYMDMGTNFTAVEDEAHRVQDFVYLPRAVKLRDRPLGVIADADLLAQLKRNAAAYTGILVGTAVNEIVINYRHHAGGFPVFAQCTPERRFRQFLMNLEGEIAHWGNPLETGERVPAPPPPVVASADGRLPPPPPRL